jgi:hypothetical protein
MAKNAEIEKLLQECAKVGKPFIYSSTEEQDEEEKQFAHFLFVGKDEAREVIYETYMSTLSYEYHMTVFDEMEQKFFEKYPQLQEVDFFELEEKYQVEQEAIVDQIYAEDKIRVQEDLIIFEEEEEENAENPRIVYLGMEVFLNVPEITEKVISDFVRSFNADTFELSEDVFSFAHQA